MHFNITIALLYNPINRGQAQPSAFSFIFGGKKGFKDVGLGGSVHANSSVSYSEEHVWARLEGVGILPCGQFVDHSMLGFNYYFPAGRHCVASIHGKIKDYLFDLPLIGLHGGQA